MANRVVLFFLKFVTIMLVQVLLLNGLHLHGTIQPYIFPLLILMMPMDTAHWLLILFGFLVGLIVDFDLNTGAIFAACSVLIAFLRPFVLSFFIRSQKMGDKEMQPSIRSQGFGFFWRFAGLLLLIFHLFLFILEPYTFERLGFALLKLVLSLSISFGLIILTDLIINPSGIRNR